MSISDNNYNIQLVTIPSFSCGEEQCREFSQSNHLIFALKKQLVHGKVNIYRFVLFIVRGT